jgi:hypothetical protein
MKIQIPENWSDIKLKQFQNYTSEMRKDLNETTRLIQTISSFCDIKFEDAVRMKIKDVNKIAMDIQQLLKIVPDSLIQIFEFNETKYGFIPKLDDITIGEYADLEFYLSKKEKMWDNMHWIMSILYREIEEEKDGKYLIKDYEPSKERAELFRNLGMNVVYSASNFFLLLGEELLMTMPSYILKTEQAKMKKEMKTKMNGDGSKLSTTSPTEILQNLKKSKNNT